MRLPVSSLRRQPERGGPGSLQVELTGSDAGIMMMAVTVAFKFRAGRSESESQPEVT